MLKVTFDDISKELLRNNIVIGEIDQLPCYGIYHIHDWDGGYESSNGYNGTKNNFYTDIEIMLQYFRDFLRNFNIGECIVAPFYNNTYFEKWSDINRVDIYNDLNSTLKSFNININSRDGFRINLIDEWPFVTKIIEGGFRYICTLCFYFIQYGILFEPTHNFEFLFHLKDNNHLSKLEELVYRYKELRFYRR